MATQLLQCGVPQTITQNTVYALPQNRCLLFSDATTPTFQQSTDVGFATNVAVTLVGGQAELAGLFLRVTSAGPIVIVLKDQS